MLCGSLSSSLLLTFPESRVEESPGREREITKSDPKERERERGTQRPKCWMVEAARQLSFKGSYEIKKKKIWACREDSATPRSSRFQMKAFDVAVSRNWNECENSYILSHVLCLVSIQTQRPSVPLLLNSDDGQTPWYLPKKGIKILKYVWRQKLLFLPFWH